MRVCQTGFLLLFAAAFCLPTLASEKPQRVEDAYPGLTSGALAYAALGDLPDGVLLRSGAVQVSARELQENIDTAPETLKNELKKNAPFVLEQMVTGKLLLDAARKSAAGRGVDLAAKSERDIIDDYLESVASAVKVGDDEAKAFYDRNGTVFGDAPFDGVKDEIEVYVLQQKKETAVMTHVRTLGQRMEIVVSAAWLKEQAPLVRDNPVDKARLGGKPAFVDFGGAGCCGPDQMQPVLDAVEEKFKDKLAVLYVEAKDNQMLAARYGISSIPAQVLFDKDGREVFRHSGAMSEEEIAEQLKAVGIK
jgi:thioredoxin 1